MIITITPKNLHYVEVGSHIRIDFDHYSEGDKERNFWATVTERTDDHIYYRRDDGWKGHDSINYFEDGDFWADHGCHITHVKAVEVNNYVCRVAIRTHSARAVLTRMLTHDLMRPTIYGKKIATSNVPKKLRQHDVFPGFTQRVQEMPLLVKEAGMLTFLPGGKVSGWDFQAFFMMAAVYIRNLKGDINYEKACEVWKKQNYPHLLSTRKQKSFEATVVAWKPFKKWVIANHHRFLWTKAERRLQQIENDKIDEEEYRKECDHEYERESIKDNLEEDCDNLYHAEYEDNLQAAEY